MNKRKVGSCHLCGRYGELSYEHVPPRAAYNDRQAVYDTIFSWPRGAKKKSAQNGIGDYTLCQQCNNDTGSWYGAAFVEWVRQALVLNDKTNGLLSLGYPFELYPLRVFKQIMTMVFALNEPPFSDHHFYLVKFVLDKQSTLLPDRYHVYTYFNLSRFGRVSNLAAVVQQSTPITLLAEISWFPLGYLVCSHALPQNLLFTHKFADITHFSKYEYERKVTQYLSPPLLPVTTPFPLDFRTEVQVTTDYVKTLGGQLRKELR